jgi:hypothetical protein
MNVETETVKVAIPKAMSNFIEKQEWFKYYRNFEDFVLDAVRLRMEYYMKAYKHSQKNLETGTK